MLSIINTNLTILKNVLLSILKRSNLVIKKKLFKGGKGNKLWILGLKRFQHTELLT